MRLVLENIQGIKKPIKRGFGNEYLVEFKDGHREYVPEKDVENKVVKFYEKMYSKDKSKKNKK